MKKYLFLKIFLFLLLLLVFYLFFPLQKTAKTFYIFASNNDSTIKALEDNGYTVRWLDHLLIRFSKVPRKGWYRVECNSCTRFTFFTTLHDKKTETMNVVVYAGETAEELTYRLANDMKLDQRKLLRYYSKHTLFNEADIFANRYTIARNADENTTMSYLFSVSRKALVSYAVKNFDVVPELSELKVLLTMASIIQKESNSVDEMYLISSVIYNRLKKGMKLQMDSTLNYGKYSHTIVTPERIKTDTSYYNTYKHKGLPLHPLSAVTLDALHAAKYPAENDYLFFMLAPKKGHNFSATYAEHLANIKTFRVHQEEKKEKKEIEKKKREAASKKSEELNITIIEKKN